MIIAYIYITAVIYMIKSDLIKQHMELIKIVTVQEQMREEIEKEKKKETKEDEKDKDSPEEEPEAEVKVNREEKDTVDNEADGSEI